MAELADTAGIYRRLVGARIRSQLQYRLSFVLNLVGMAIVTFLDFAVILVLFILVLLWQFVGLWVQAFMSNAGVSMFDLIGMKFRKVDARSIVLSRIRAVKAGLERRIAAGAGS